MAFPQTPLPVIVEIAPGAEPADDPNNWTYQGLWVDITDDVRVSQGVTIEQGRPDEANQVDPSRCTLAIDNRSGNYSPRNPLGQWYGLLARNTPMRVKLQRLTETFTRTVASGSWGTSDSGNSWSGSGTAWSVNGSQGVVTLPTANTGASGTAGGAGAWDFELRATMAIDAVPAGAEWINLINFRRTGNNDTYQFWIEWETNGTVTLRLVRILAGATTFITTVSNVLTGYTANTPISVYLKAEGGFIGAKAWYTNTGSMPSAWSISSSAEGLYGLENTSLGTNIQVQSSRITGNTNNTTGTWDNIDVTATLFVGNVVEWPVRWDQSGNDSIVPITASGVLRRLQQGASPLQSPIYSVITAAAPFAYWPLEDESGSQSAQGFGTNVRPASVFSSDFGYDGVPLGGSKSTMSITQDTTISGTLPSTSFVPSVGWEVDFFLLTEALPPSGQDAVVMQISTGGDEPLWQLKIMNTGVFAFTAFDAAGNSLTGVSAAGLISANIWYGLRLEVKQNGADILAQLTINNLASGVSTATGYYTVPVATTGLPKKWSIYGSSTSFPAGSVGHVAFFNRGTVFSNEPFNDAAGGYAGETPAQRIIRLCAQQGVRLDVMGDTDFNTFMGPQSADTFLNILREAEQTDLGVLSEFAGGLRYRSRMRRYGQLSRLTLDFNSGHIAEPPEPTDDDQRLRNDWTVSRKNGSSARFVDDAHVAKYGRYDDSVEINPSSDSVLDDHASFRVYLDTFDDLRWPSISLDLARNPSLIERAMSLEVGTVIFLLNPPSELPVGTIRLLTEGWKQTLKPYAWDVEVNCASAVPWRILTVDSAGMLVDSEDSSLNADITASATSIAVTRPAGSPGWTTDPTEVPFDINVGGEQMTVTAVSGTGAVQTFTVTRAVNNVSKAHTAGTAVSLWLPAYVGL